MVYTIYTENYNLNKGVRQTNSLKSTLFNIFINDLRPLFVQEKWTPVEVIWCRWFKKSLRIPKGQSESVYRRTDNTMAKRKSANGQTTIYRTRCEHASHDTIDAMKPVYHVVSTNIYRKDWIWYNLNLTMTYPSVE
jgi:hypothetical protein